MSDIVFILGAGASFQCGAPLMNTFLETAGDLRSRQKVEDVKDQFDFVKELIARLQIVHSKSQLDLTNIESVLTTFELGTIIGGISNISEEEFQKGVDSLKTVISRTLEETVLFRLNPHRQITPPRPYAEFAQLVSLLQNNGKTVSILTFNYDIAIDTGLIFSGLNPNYAIEKPDSTLGNRLISLLKLHGSLAWQYEKKNGTIRIAHLKNYLASYSEYCNTSSIDPANRFAYVHLGEILCKYFQDSRGIQTNPIPVIIPPSANKSEHHSKLRSVWKQAAKELSEAQYIYIIGYSLPETDSFFKQLFALGSVGGQLLRRIMIFNPDVTGTTENRFKSLLGPGSLPKFEYLPLDFANAIESLKKYGH